MITRMGKAVETPAESGAAVAACARTRIVREWRRLTRGESGRTLVACSGGADSTALAIALAEKARRRIVLAHIVHDLRPREEALADRDAVRGLAERFDVEFVEAEIAPAAASGGRGNLEKLARDARYEVLLALAARHVCTFVATGHQAEDQAETILMALMRGCGPVGAYGMVAKRRLRGGVMLIRPMLCITRREAESVCDEAGVMWRVDATNLDAGRLRAALRSRVLPALESIRPGSMRRMSGSSAVVRAGMSLVLQEANKVWQRGTELPSGGRMWNRGDLVDVPRIVVAQMLRNAPRMMMEGRGLDRLNSKVVRSIVRAALDDMKHERRWDVGVIRVEVRARTLIIMPREKA